MPYKNKYRRGTKFGELTNILCSPSNTTKRPTHKDVCHSLSMKVNCQLT